MSKEALLYDRTTLANVPTNVLPQMLKSQMERVQLLYSEGVDLALALEVMQWTQQEVVKRSSQPQIQDPDVLRRIMESYGGS